VLVGLVGGSDGDVGVAVLGKFFVGGLLCADSELYQFFRGKPSTVVGVIFSYGFPVLCVEVGVGPHAKFVICELKKRRLEVFDDEAFVFVDIHKFYGEDHCCSFECVGGVSWRLL